MASAFAYYEFQAFFSFIKILNSLVLKYINLLHIIAFIL